MTGGSWRTVVLGAALAVSTLCGAVQAEAARYALVIGNDSYTKLRRLENARADARAVGAALRGLSGESSFDKVVVETDVPTRSRMLDLLREFRAKLRQEDEAVFFFSGHGVEVDGSNYLLPVDLENRDRAYVMQESVGLDDVLAMLDAGAPETRPRFTLVVLDACRDNPFGKAKGYGSRGLAPVSTASGQMVIFAAGARQRALDKLRDDDPVANGVFTRVWLKAISEPGVSVREVMPRVRREVAQLARSSQYREEQIPAVYDQAEGEFYFLKGAATKLDPTWAPAPSGDPVNAPRASPSASAARKDLEVFHECEVCPEMVVIPSGEYEMGSPVGEGSDDERPQHWVKVGRFALGKYEVTQGEWRALMGSNPSFFKDCGDECPVEQVNWSDAQAFIRKLNEKVSGRPEGSYRLPSEAEWEYACRGGTKGQAFCGDDQIGKVAWSKGDSTSKTQRVGTKAANRYGLHDLTGNVWEWLEDCWNGSYRRAPSDGSAWRSGDCSSPVVRGGSWQDAPPRARAASRSAAWSMRYGTIGFRVARTLP